MDELIYVFLFSLDSWQAVKLASMTGLPSTVLHLPTFLALSERYMHIKPVVIVMMTKSDLPHYCQVSNINVPIVPTIAVIG